MYFDNTIPICVYNATKSSKDCLKVFGFLEFLKILRFQEVFYLYEAFLQCWKYLNLYITLHKIHGFSYIVIFSDFLHFGLTEIYNLKYTRLQMLL